MDINKEKVQPDLWANLLWALGAPDIVRGSGLPWLPAQRRAELTAYFSRAEIAARLAPLLDVELRNRDERGSAGRLGVYFENLWAFAFANHPAYALLHRNLPLRAAGRTLGELDFVVRHQPSGSVEHWEIAVKFYLQVAGEYWVGPGLRDRLDIKLARMREHQLPLIRQPAAVEILQHKDIHIDRQWALMPGRLFRPLGEDAEPLHTAINPGACHYWWAPLDEFQFHFCERPLHWIRLPKRTWLAERNHPLSGADSCATLADHLRTMDLRSPVCVAALNTHREVSRGFIVPDDWYESALLAI
ncbi:hypothetical protein SAMN04487965_1458 [Microbulbifer donghaiensis]|uniref:DUF1853 domain-containing protein n=1 Tax=Microbulbifer donghaiensis TaxID=494016 RepID=A0A1M4Z7E8_9GAMM|nr:DUF1853 family protein [Microbulbifer donghaiensis]SHF13878.1 hypothetical protein SAMN04487965_1458 [Microbulbifer donghaiensis]